MPAALDKLSSLDSEVKELRQEVQKCEQRSFFGLATSICNDIIGSPF